MSSKQQHEDGADWADKLSGWLFAQRLKLALLCVVLLLVATPGLARLSYTTDIYHFFADNDPLKQDYQHMVEQFSSTNLLLFLLDMGDLSIWSAEGSRMIQEVHERIVQLPAVSRVRSPYNARYLQASGDTLSVVPLLDDLDSLDAADIEARRQYAAEDPLVRHMLVSADQRVVVFMAELDWQQDNYVAELEAAVLAAKALQKSVDQQSAGRQKLWVGGDVLLEYSLLEAMQRDLLKLFPIVTLLGGLILLYLVRKVMLALVALCCVFASVYFSAGLVGWLGVTLDMTSSNFALLAFIVCLADIAHLLMNFVDALKQGLAPQQAMAQSMKLNLKAIVLTSLTTAIGFMTLNLAASPTFSALGNLSALGVFAGLVFSLCLFPALACCLSYQRIPSSASLKPLISRIARLALQRRKAILLLTLVLALLSALAVPLNHLDDNVMHYFAPDHPLRQTLDLSNRHFGNYQRLILSLDSGEADGINDPRFLAYLEQLLRWLDAQPEVDFSLSYAQLIKDISRTLHDDDPAAYRLPESRDIAAQYLLLYELDLPPGEDLRDLLNADRSALRVLVVLSEEQGQTRSALGTAQNRQDRSNDSILQLEQRIRAWHRQQDSGYSLQISGSTLMFSQLSRAVVDSMMLGSLMALLGVGLVLWIGLGSWRLALISFVPNLFPALLVYGLWGLLDGALTMSVAVTFSVSLGIIVDDTVHILSKFNKRLAEGQDVEAAVTETLASTGSALILTTLFVASALLVQAQSDFGITATVGQICAPVIMVALLFDLFLLPGLLMMLGRRRLGFSALAVSHSGGG